MIRSGNYHADVYDDLTLNVEQQVASSEDHEDEHKYHDAHCEDHEEEIAYQKITTVQSWLVDELGLGQYLHKFVVNGFERMDIVIEIKDEEKLREIGVEIPGHRRAIYADILKRRMFRNIM